MSSSMSDRQRPRLHANGERERGSRLGFGKLLRPGLAPRIIAAILLAAIATGGIIGVTLTNTSRHELRRTILDNNLSHADLAAQFASQYISVIRSNVRSFASRPTVQRAVLAGQPEQVRGELIEFLQTQPALDSVSIYDAQGIARVSGFLNAQNIGVSHTDREWFRQALSSRTPYLGLATRSRVTGRATLPYAVPILDGKGEVAGVLVGGISLKVLSDAIIGVAMAPDARAALNDTRAGGVILAHKDPRRILTPVSGRNEAHRLMAKGERGAIESLSSAGEPNLIAYTPVPDLPWGILIIRPSATALAPVAKLTKQAVLIIILSIIVTGIGGTFWTRKITRPLIDLRNAAGKIAAGDLTRRVAVRQADEIGDLGQAFNQMAAALAERETALASVQKAKTAAEMIDGVLDPVAITDVDGRIRQVNRAFYEVFGFDETIIGKLPTEIVRPEDIEPVLKSIERALAEGAVNNFECTIVAGDGRQITVLNNIKLMRDEGGRPQGFTTVLRDIADRKQIEESLARSEEKFRLVAESASDLIYEWDIATGSLEWSGRIDEILGYEMGSFPRNIAAWEGIIHPDDLPCVAAALDNHLLNGAPYRQEYRVRRQDGGALLWTDRGIALRDENGRPYRMIGACSDVTEVREKNQALEEAYEDLERSYADLEQYAYVASHDLQEPLRMIVSYVQLIERRYRDRLDDDGKVFMDFAMDGAARMQTLIRDLLTYARVGRGGLNPKPTDLKALAGEVLEDLKITVEESGAVVTVDALPVVTADRSQMAQLLQNLISNAVKFRGAQPPDIKIGARLEDENWLVFVRDNGIGIDKAHLEKIFTMFQRLQRREDYIGTGAGLAIARRIVERHRGRIWIESALGTGTTVYFTLPVHAGS